MQRSATSHPTSSSEPLDTDGQGDVERLVRLAFDAAPSGMLFVDAERRIVSANEQVERIFGYERNELLGRTVETLLPPAHRDGHPSQFASFLEHPTRRAMGEGRDLAGVRNDGSEVPVEVGLTPVETSGGTYVLAAIVDITERKRMEAELKRKSDEMEQLFYAVSHDLKSPLVTLSGFAGMLATHVEEGARDKALDAASRVRRSAATMARLIDDVLDLSRTGAQELAPERLPLADVIEEVVSTLESSIARVGARVEVLAPLPYVRADRGQLVRALLNLIENALKYGCAEPGACVSVGAEASEREVRVFVRDQGPGIEPRFHERIFRLFQRLSRDDRGTGLGLATVSKVVDRHGGRAWVESAPGAGATFWMAFPGNAMGGQHVVP